jgi:hypothetical protein
LTTVSFGHEAAMASKQGIAEGPVGTVAIGPLLLELRCERVASTVLAHGTVLHEEKLPRHEQRVVAREIQAYVEGSFLKLNELHPLPLDLRDADELGELTDPHSTKKLQRARTDTLEVMEEFVAPKLAEGDPLVVTFPNNKITVVIDKHTKDFPFRVIVHKNAESGGAPEMVAAFCIRNDGASLSLESGVINVVADESLQRSRCDFLAYCFKCGTTLHPSPLHP